MKKKSNAKKKATKIKKPAKAKKTKVLTKKKTKLTKSKVCCTKCGECKGVSKDRMAKLIATFGSIEELHANYVCRGCRKEHNVRADGKLKPAKRTRKKKILKKDENGVTQLPKWMEDVSTAFPGRKPATPESLRATKTCWHPTQWVERGRVCDGCPSIARNTCGSTKNFSKDGVVKVKSKKIRKKRKK